MKPRLRIGAVTKTDWLLLGFSHSSYRIEVRPGRRTVFAGDVVFVIPGASGIRDAASRCLARGDYLWFPEEAILSALAQVDPTARDRVDAPFLLYNAPLDPETFLLQRRLFRYLLDTSVPDPLFVEELSYKVLSRCAALASRPHSFVKRATTQAAQAEATERARQFIIENLDQPLHIDAISRAARLSPTHFRQVFRTQTGTSIHQYATDLRLKAAFDRLGDYRGNYTRLGLDLGFSSGQHFSNAFRHRFGVPPLRLLRSLGAQERPHPEGRFGTEGAGEQLLRPGGQLEEWLTEDSHRSRRVWPYIVGDPAD